MRTLLRWLYSRRYERIGPWVAVSTYLFGKRIGMRYAWELGRGRR